MKKAIQIFNLLVLLFLASVIFKSCSSSSMSSRQPTSWNLASIYNPLKSNLHPAFKIYHNTQNTSIIFFKIRTSELYFQQNVVSNKEQCSFTLDYLLQEINEESNFITDSNRYVYEFEKADIDNYYITQIPIKAIEGKSYRLKVTLRDNNRKVFNISYIEIEKKRNFAQQYFNITSINGTPLFRNIIINDGAFLINHSTPTADKLYISYYKNQTPIPKPTIATSSDKFIYRNRDSLFIVDYKRNTALSLQYEGLYFAQFDTNSTEGISILKLNKDFPKVKEPEGLLSPLSYITTDAEFQKLYKEKNAKLAADDFWIKIGGSIEKGRELIRLYYNRVYFSNYYFSNTKPGWKTDRGMIYIVYGPPHKIKKTAKKETWIYERKGDKEPIKFLFKYTPNKYNLNNFVLQRTNNHEWHWTEAVYAWTSGDIFLYD